MQIELGKPVVSKDGERVGRVDRIALDYDTREVEQIIVHQGVLLTRDRIVDRDLIERVEDDGTVRLAITAAEVERLPEFVEAEFVRPTEEDLRSLPYVLPGVPVATGATILWTSAATRRSGSEQPYQEFDPASGPLIGPAVAPDTPLEARSNLPEDTLLIGRGTDVLDREGEKLGRVEEVETNEDGEVVAFVVRAGLLLHHDIRVPIDWVSSVTSEEVHLRLSAQEIESQGQPS
ncbi:PRC-barrel domain-containing protein [Thermomicrobiaceae bacterium CFH 74404]|uniref:PRC-barrel domain-containing protein n=1 Tax=Thermalbibacter longus TaxID=2951981 RepID=A0AA41WB04_9BACT|nr:PRC-barrel domain-containing protein [Thermalbibacter longus]MCM8749614.1 PRC-barrel domain-containing protein [Thermalbibacter longus]